METPIVYPTIEVPGKGTYTVKFGARVMYLLEKHHGMTPEQFVNRLQRWLPQVNPSTGEIIQGHSSFVFMFEVLSACLWNQTKMSPEDLADAFDGAELSAIGPIILESFSKAQRPAVMRLQEPAAPIAKEPTAPVLN